MDMMYQMMDQLQSAGAAQTAPNRGAQSKDSGRDSGDFDSMVRQKQQEVRQSQSGQKKPASQEKTQNTKTDGTEETVIPDEQYALAAALLYQIQPNVDNVEMQVLAPETTEVVQTVVQTDVQTDVQTVTQTIVQELTPETVVKAPELAAEQPVEATEEKPVFETVIAPKAEEAQAETAPVIAHAVTRSPETFAVREEQTDDEELPVELVQLETPVFGEVDAVPVKVAEPSAPLPLEAEDGIEQLSARIETLLVNENGDQTVELTLSPESLGTVRVEITHTAEGALHVQLSATTQRAVNLLERGAVNLQNLLTTGGRPSVEVHVRGGEDAQQQFLNPNDQNGQQQQQQQNRQRQPQEQQRDHAQDFMQQLRLGLVGNDGE